MKPDKDCIIDFQDESGTSRAWIKTSFSRHPGEFLSFIDESGLKQGHGIVDAIKDSLMEFRSGFSRLPFPKHFKDNPNTLYTDFLYEVRKEKGELWIKFYIKTAQGNRLVLLDEGNHERLLRVYKVPVISRVPEFRAKHSSIR